MRLCLHHWSKRMRRIATVFNCNIVANEVDGKRFVLWAIMPDHCLYRVNISFIKPYIVGYFHAWLSFMIFRFTQIKCSLWVQLYSRGKLQIWGQLISTILISMVNLSNNTHLQWKWTSRKVFVFIYKLILNCEGQVLFFISFVWWLR